MNAALTEEITIVKAESANLANTVSNLDNQLHILSIQNAQFNENVTKLANDNNMLRTTISDRDNDIAQCKASLMEF